jgi:hypothetical protein
LFSKNKFIPCCDDERCESVENLRNPLRRQLVVAEVFCAFNVCISDISGKLAPGAGWRRCSSSRSNRISAPFPTLLHNRQSDYDLKS